MTDANCDDTDIPRLSKTTVDMSPEAVQARFEKVWQLTVEEWAKKGIDITKLPMRKDVERLIRLRDK